MRARPLFAVVVAAVAALTMGAVAPATANEAPSSGSDDAGVVNDVAFTAGLQWNLEQIGAPAAWATATGRGVTIAIIDSGVALDHEDLAGQLTPGISCRGTGGDPSACRGDGADDDGHGTHVAGIAAAINGNGIGVAGTAPGATIMPVKVLHRGCPACESAGNPDDVIAGVRWAVLHGADIINLSLGSTDSPVVGPGLTDALEAAWENGVIPVVASGNDLVATTELGDTHAVVVTATDRDGQSPAYAHGVGDARWGVAAPGGDGTDDVDSCSQAGSPRGILSTFWATDQRTQAYACLSGTSMASPQVSGALAILRSAGLSPTEAVERLLDTAVDLGEPGRDEEFGSGRIDLRTATTGLRSTGSTLSIGGASPGDGTITPTATDSTSTFQDPPDDDSASRTLSTAATTVAVLLAFAAWSTLWSLAVRRGVFRTLWAPARTPATSSR